MAAGSQAEKMAGAQARRHWLLLTPALATIGVFMVIPMLILLVFSFMEADPYGGVDAGLTFEAYIQLLFERDFDDTLEFTWIYLGIIWRSISLALIATVGALILGLPVAYFITRQAPRTQNLLLFLVTLPFWTNLLIRTYAWILILAQDGVIEQPLKAVGLIDGSLGMMYSNGAIAIGLIYTYLPLMVLPIYASLEKLDFRLIEAANDLYANRYRVAREVIIPLSMPGIIAGCILVFVPSLGAFVAPDLLGGGTKLMLGSLIHLQFASSRNWPFGAAIAMCLMALVMIALLVQARSAAKRRAMEAA
ncbi:MAG: ABC transporter permease [Pseudomonadota bacterium]